MVPPIHPSILVTCCTSLLVYRVGDSILGIQHTPINRYLYLLSPPPLLTQRALRYDIFADNQGLGITVPAFGKGVPFKGLLPPSYPTFLHNTVYSSACSNVVYSRRPSIARAPLLPTCVWLFETASTRGKTTYICCPLSDSGAGLPMVAEYRLQAAPHTTFLQLTSTRRP